MLSALLDVQILAQCLIQARRGSRHEVQRPTQNLARLIEKILQSQQPRQAVIQIPGARQMNMVEVQINGCHALNSLCAIGYI